MILECKSCKKKFIVPDSAITSNGRLVQCSSCGNKWTQFPINKKSVVEPKIIPPKVLRRKGKFKSLLLDRNFEEAKNLTLEELNENTCKYMEGNPNEPDARFCGRKNVEKFSYCPLHLMIVFQPKGKKDEMVDKEDEVPKFIQKKIKSA